MELDYPSEKRHDLSSQLNRLDKKFGSVVLSSPQICLPSKQLPDKIKRKALDLTEKDQATKLIHFMDSEAISLCDEISKEGLGWSILHFAAKNNSSKCIELCLRWLYQSEAENFERILNQKNGDGDTPLLVGCIYKSNEVIKILLAYGGADIYAINSKKLTAYQIALTSFNEEGLQMLMKYELKVKKKKNINKEALSVPIPKYEVRAFESLYACFMDCFYFEDSPIEPSKDTETDRKIMRVNDQNGVPNIEILWSEADQVLNKKLPVFSSVSHPFSMKQSNVIVSRLMIVFQGIAEHPELLKKIIFPSEGKYYVKLGGSKEERIIWIDNLFPFFESTREPLFLSLDDQLWPMILQKALTQYFNGYFEPAKVEVGKLLQTITGNEYFRLSFSPTENKDIHEEYIKSTLSQIQQNDCILVLEPNSHCPLKSEEGRNECFSLLKIVGDEFLINCPFVLNAAERRESRETRDMKLHRAHYHNPACTPKWLNSSEFFSYFDCAIFCHTIPATSMRTTIVKAGISRPKIYMTIKIKERMENDKIYVTFKSISEDRTIIPISCNGWNTKSALKQSVEKLECEILGSARISNIYLPTELIICCEFEEKESDVSFLNVICRSESISEIEALDCTIGDLEFIECCKKYFSDHCEEFDSPIIQPIGQYLLVMAVSTNLCFIEIIPGLSEENVVEGLVLKDEGKLEMFQFSNIHFLVLTGVGIEQTKDIKVMSYESTPDINSESY